MSDPIVTVSEGKVKGRILENIHGGQFYSFQGIPYGKSPVGELRFRAPLPAEPWDGIFDGTEEGPQSIQKHYLTKEILGSEDCLNLNVYTPELFKDGTKLKPVMVFIHGGAFAQGSNKTEIYGPDFLLTEDIVLVVINYRLGIFGFLSLDDPSLNVPGNAAFKDMTLSLKWVQKNIANFSGDPNNVTIFGESAGGAAAHLLMLSPLSQGLFHKVIAQSGCALNGWIYGIHIAKELAKDMGFESDNEKDILKFFQDSSVEDIYKGQLALDSKDTMANKPRYIGVVVEKPCDQPAFFTTSPIEIFLSGKYNKVPAIFGYNNMEGMLFDILISKEKQVMYWTDYETNVPGILNLEKGSAISKVVGDKIYKFYFGNSKEPRVTHTKELYNLTTDNCFLRGIYSSVKNLVANAPEVPVFMYRMSIETDLNTYKRLTGMTLEGVCHADDLGYLFKNIFTPHITEGSIEDIAQRRFVRLWTNFARHGDPTYGADPLLNIKWIPAEKNKLHYLDIGKTLTMECNPEPRRMAFWDEVFRIRPITSKL